MPIAHSHDGYEETIYGLDGVLTWTVEGTPTEIGPGDALYPRAASSTRFDNTGDTDAKALAIVTPGSLGPTTFARQWQSSPRLAAGRPNSERSQRRWVATA